MSTLPTHDQLQRKIEELKKKAQVSETCLDQLAPIFNFSLDMIGSGNLQGYFTKVNPSFEHILGYPEKEFLHAPFLDFVHPDDIDETRKALEAAAAGQREIYIVNRYRCKDDSYKWIDWRVQAFRDENLFIAVGRDITKQKALENELRRSEKRYRNIIQTSNDGFLQTDDNGRITDCNSAYLKMTGYSREELFTKSIDDIDAIESSGETNRHIMELIGIGWGCFESVHKKKDGSTFDVEVSTTFIEEEGIFVAFVKDISERNRIQAAIRESEERFRQLAETIPEVFWLGSLDWQEIYYISPAYAKVWGRGCEELYRNPYSWINSVVEQDREKVEQAIPVTIDTSVESIAFPDYRIRQPNGEIRWIRARAFPVMDADGTIYRIAGIAADITQEKNNELEKEKLLKELQIALEQVKTLSGFLPICSSCKKIRDDKGYWAEIESYIQEHSEAEFTHSLCPECTIKIYPEIAASLIARKNKK